MTNDSPVNETISYVMRMTIELLGKKILPGLLDRTLDRESVLAIFDKLGIEIDDIYLEPWVNTLLDIQAAAIEHDHRMTGIADDDQPNPQYEAVIAAKKQLQAALEARFGDGTQN